MQKIRLIRVLQRNIVLMFSTSLYFFSTDVKETENVLMHLTKTFFDELCQSSGCNWYIWELRGKNNVETLRCYFDSTPTRIAVSGSRLHFATSLDYH